MPSTWPSSNTHPPPSSPVAHPQNPLLPSAEHRPTKTPLSPLPLSSGTPCDRASLLSQTMILSAGHSLWWDSVPSSPPPNLFLNRTALALFLSSFFQHYFSFLHLFFDVTKLRQYAYGTLQLYVQVQNMNVKTHKILPRHLMAIWTTFSRREVKENNGICINKIKLRYIRHEDSWIFRKVIWAVWNTICYCLCLSLSGLMTTGLPTK